MMRFDIVSIFPEILDSYWSESILGRAQKKRLIKIQGHDIKEFGKGNFLKHVDDKPYGGGAGMLFCFEPVYKTLKKIRPYGSKAWRVFHKKLKTVWLSQPIKKYPRTGIFLMAANGEVFDQKKAETFAKNYDRIILLCGRYEGIDARIEECIDGKLRVGEYVLTGGELAAGIIVDAVTRLIPGVLGDDESSQQESFSEHFYLEHAHYTKPSLIEVAGKKLSVPEVLLSGDHKKIAQWREKNSVPHESKKI